MSENSKLEAYLNKVCEQVRWECAHDTIKTELQNHITDQQEGFIKNGEAEEAAFEKAILEMGDPTLAGSLLDKAYRPKINWWLLIPSILMLILGMLAQIFANGEVNQNYLLSLFIGASAFTACAFFDYRKLIKPSLIMLISALLLALALYTYKNAGHNFNISNSYIFLFCPLLFAASACRLAKMQMKGFLISLVLFCLMVTASMTCTTSMLNAIVTAISGLLILTAAIVCDMFGINKRLALLLLYLPTALVAFLIMLTKGSSIAWRLSLLINPTQNSGWLALHIKGLLSSANFIGTSEGLAKWNELNFNSFTSDLFLTKTIIKMGWIVLIIVGLLLTVILFQGIKASLKQKSNVAKLFSLSIVITLFIQAISYISYNLGYFIAIEFPIPLFSGNVSTVINLILIGVLFSIFRYSAVAKDNIRQKEKPKRLFELSNGSLTINYK